MEEDLHRLLALCEENLDHSTFIPSSQFNVKNPPWPRRDPALLADCIRSVSELTVRVSVSVTAMRQPAYLIRCRYSPRSGNGWIHSIYRFPDKYNSHFKTCPCKECCASSMPSHKFAFIRINTSTNVVFDDSEGEHTTCHLFLNKGSLSDLGNHTVTLSRMWRMFSDVITDRCSMIHVTHDMGLAARLEKLTIYRDYLKESYVMNSLLYSRFPDEVPNQHATQVCLESNHHGCVGSVSYGIAMVRHPVREVYRSCCMFDTATCPGSSGSYNSADSPTNSQVQQEIRGPVEVQECLPETDLHNCFLACKKNPGHKNFTPIDEFSEQHLPPDRRHLVEHIKVLGNIVALVEVKKISRDRPITFPGTNIKYPRSSQRGSSWIYKVLTFGNSSGWDMGKCTCEECHNSDDPKTNFAYIIIHTAAHVVFDEFEGKHTTCYLFFDKGKTLEACAGVVKLSGMSGVWSDVEKDVCKMLHVTHDPDVICCVENVVNEWEIARRSLELMDRIKSPSESPSVDSNHKILTIAVSHPHGCSKQVSIGQCVSVDNTSNGQTVYKYTTPTCPGSSGAYVYVLGREWQSWDDHLHSRRKDGENELK